MEFHRADASKKAIAEKKLPAARAALAQAKKALETPGENYTPLRGAQKTVESPTETDAQRSKPFPTTSTGRRTALARWMTDPRHPLTARVAVNHMWVRHFGQPLVPAVFDFGRRSATPTHLALLDYLAVELCEHHWSMKHLHRLMVTSATYRLTSSSAGATPAQAADAENHFYWRMNSARMESQVVRDSLLHLGGELDPTIGGPSIDPAKDEQSRRRSLYFVHSHNDHHKFLSMFDDASVLECYRRAESIVPQQALALSNSKLAMSMAEKIAARLSQQPGTVADTKFIRAAFETVLAYQPNAAELTECEQTLAQLMAVNKAQKQANPEQRARTALVHALLNHNDFITIR